MGSVSFDNRVAIVTGAGAGLGRAYALELARRGVRVVVNDLSRAAADAVVAEIASLGGSAKANCANVTKVDDVEAMVSTAIEQFGQVDILINNAGILRDKSFSKMTLTAFQTVVDVHLMGAVNCSKAVWDHMKERGYGRIAMTTSSSGLYGNFGQTNYGAAKMALVGLMNVLSIEGAKNDVRVNAISPVATTQMTDGLLAPEAADLLTTDSVAAGMMTLVCDEAPNRMMLAAGAGCYSTVRIHETTGVSLPIGEQTAENVMAHMDEISDMRDAREIQQGAEQTIHFLTSAMAQE